MPPFKKNAWVTEGTSAVARMLHDRIFEDHTEFPVGTTIAYERSQFMVGVVTKIARFDGKHWDITGEESQLTTVELIESLQSLSLLKIWLLDDGATIYEKETS